MAKPKSRATNNTSRSIAIFIVIIGAFLFFKAQSDTTSDDKNPLSSNTPRRTSSAEEIFQSTKSYLSDVFNNKVTFNPTFGANTIESVGKTIGVVQGTSGWSVEVNSFKYQKDKAVFDAIKGGSGEKIDLNKEIVSYLNLKLGQQKTFTCASLSGCAVSEVIGHKLGNKIWGSTEVYHTEGGWSTIYYTYDKKLQIISYVNIYFNKIDKLDSEKGVLNNHPEIASIIKQFEKEALAF